MSGQQGHIVSQWPDTFTYRLQQGLVITPGEIRPADRTLENHIANDRDPILFMHEDDVPRGVTRAVVDLQLLIAEPDLICL